MTVSIARVGCSGWQYRHWRGSFYPAGIPVRQWFAHYASQFDTVELNNTFYRLPDEHTFEIWRANAPSGFLYALKASRFLTHMRKLKEPVEPLHRFFDRAASLGSMLGPVLYQLPTGWSVDSQRLTAFLRALPKGPRHAIEFRDPSWYRHDIFALLERHRVALCLHDMSGSATGRVDVGPFVYVRLHGPRKYSGRYDDRTLNGWAEWLNERLSEGRPVFAYFNNDAGGHAPRDAERLRRALRHPRVNEPGRASTTR